MKFPIIKQSNENDCGPTCLRMIAKYYGKDVDSIELSEQANISVQGVSLFDLSEAAKHIGFVATGVKIKLRDFDKSKFPCIIHWNENHFVVLVKQSTKYIYVIDPKNGLNKIKYNSFNNNFKYSNGVIYALLLNPSLNFKITKSPNRKTNDFKKRLVSYLLQIKKQYILIILSLFIVSLIQLAFPYLTQAIVDYGIEFKNQNLILIVLIGQIFLIISQAIAVFIRARITLTISNLINIQLLSDFWIKVTNLKLKYFDSHPIGDLLQRINDHLQIEAFATNSILNSLFSIVTFFTYSVLLINYNINIFLIFISGTLIYFFWVSWFLKKRKEINYKLFDTSALENNITLEIINGIQEIKLNNIENHKRWQWERLQLRIFDLKFKTLNLNQIQSIGTSVISNLQNIAITFVVAVKVINDELSLGAMLAIQYILGQLTNPLSQWVGFIQSLQDTKISLTRINYVHNEVDELNIYYKNNKAHGIISFDIEVRDLSFCYGQNSNLFALEKINLIIPQGAFVAICGSSGSGKTTLIKILLSLYNNYNGKIIIGKDDLELKSIDSKIWRGKCGAVLQDGYIFNDSVKNNIVLDDSSIDDNKLIHSCKMANIYDYIIKLPRGFDTLLGERGINLSQGQKQRILIARAFYKEPDYLFLDEATNSLDTINEFNIMTNLRSGLKKETTIVVIAHRLSTIKNADKIFVMEGGRIVEEGTHSQLLNKGGRYYNLNHRQNEI